MEVRDKNLIPNKEKNEKQEVLKKLKLAEWLSKKFTNITATNNIFTYFCSIQKLLLLLFLIL